MYTSKWVKKNYKYLLNGEQFVMITAPTQVMQCFHGMDFTQYELRLLSRILLAFQEFHTNHSSLADKGTFCLCPVLPQPQRTIRSGSGLLTRNPFCSLQNIRVTQVGLFTDDIIIIFLVSEKNSQLSLSSSLLGDKL